MNIDDLVAIDVRTHAERCCRQPVEAFWQPYEDAANRYFKAGARPSVSPPAHERLVVPSARKPRSSMRKRGRTREAWVKSLRALCSRWP